MKHLDYNHRARALAKLALSLGHVDRALRLWRAAGMDGGLEL